MISNLIFSLFAITMIISASMVIITINPIHAVLYLISVFFNATGLLILLGFEFLGLILLIVYVGAIAILFLFVVMMLNIKLVELNQNLTRYLPIGLLIGIALLIELIIALQLPLNNVTLSSNTNGLIEWMSQVISTPSTGINTLGNVLYTHYYQWFLISGLILLVAMVGAIVLTLNQRIGIKRQNLYSQLAVSADLNKF
uniref:NADH-ubiquinone oxidoreductase chain 6 n=1 Tax=Capsaspora owczarzaki TaxID=192875 RepID=M1JZG2_9EUKA|nr:NADH dehydrogenase subunit 6 [Capsaspora owczarzaki]